MTLRVARLSATPAGCPLVETHLHLEGSIPARVVRPLARRAGLLSMARAAAAGRPLQRKRRSFASFLEAFVGSASLLRSGGDVETALGALLADLRAEGIAYVEITFSPQVLLRRGVALSEIARALRSARDEAAAAGGPRCAFIADGGRLWGASWFEEMVDQIADLPECGIVAVGLGGEEAAAPSRLFRRGFERARRRGLGAVVHAGEGGAARAMREAIDHLGVTRIAHGIAAASDPALLARLRADRILLEICPTSNLMTGAVRSMKRHPLPRILDAGVRVAIATDDRTIFGTTLRKELAVAAGLGLDRDRAKRSLLDAVDGSFAPKGLRRDLVRRIEASFEG